MRRPDDELRLTLSPGALAGTLALVLLLGGAALAPETVTLSTYYPAPSGVYSRLVTGGQTALAVDPASRVGVGTTEPRFLLDAAGIANVARLSLNGIMLPSPPAGTLGMAWTPVTVPGTPGAQTVVGYSNCNVWYQNSGADTCDGATTSGYACRPGENRTCADVFDQGCSWGVRSVYVYKCVSAVPTQTFFALSASTAAASVIPVTLVPVPGSRRIQSWNPLSIY